MAFVIKTPPAANVYPVTLADAKLHCREDSIDNDSAITGFIAAATALIDGPGGILNWCLCKQSWYFYQDVFPDGSQLAVNLWPVASVDAFEYLDSNGVWQPVPAASYVSDLTRGNAQINLNSGYSWPTPKATQNAVRVTLTAGYDTQNATPVPVPSDLQLAIKMSVAHWYENRGLILDDRRLEVLPMAAEALLAKYRRISF